MGGCPASSANPVKFSQIDSSFPELIMGDKRVFSFQSGSKFPLCQFCLLSDTYKPFSNDGSVFTMYGLFHAPILRANTFASIFRA